MTFAEDLKRIRQRSFLSQEAFARELGVAFSTVNRWECGKAKPNFVAMKSIKDFCQKNTIDFSTLEELWLSVETTKKQAGMKKNVSLKN